jgi:hypothetical protein
MIQQYNLDLQRQLPGSTVLTVAYVGSRGSHLQTENWNLDTAPPNLQIDPSNLRPYPQFYDIIGLIDRGLSRYDSLQLKAEKAYQNGLYFLVAYTYSKGFDNGLNDDLGSLVGVPYYPLNPAPNAYPLNPNGFTDKGLNITDQKHNFSASMLYRLPFGRGAHFASGASRITDAIIGKWQANVITHIASGFPIGLATGVNNSGTAIGNRPNQICNGKLSHPTVEEFFNTSFQRLQSSTIRLPRHFHRFTWLRSDYADRQQSASDSIRAEAGLLSGLMTLWKCSWRGSVGGPEKTSL